MGSPMCDQQLQCFLAIAQFTGIPIESSKTTTPTTRLPVHGIEVDTVVGQAGLPQDKLHHLTELLVSFSWK